MALCRDRAGTHCALLYRMEQANAGRGGEKHVFESAAAPAVRPVALRGAVCIGAGARHFYHGCFSGWGADVSGRVSSHRLRHRLFAQILGRDSEMKIVVWKSPKALSALLRCVFGVRKEA